MNLKNIALPLNRLMLDPNNYRLDYDREIRRFGDDEVRGEQEDTLERLEKERLGELRSSIVQNGFLEMDRIVVRKLKVQSDEELYLVVEGNRRTAALKGLIEDHINGEIKLPERVLEKSKSIDVIYIEGSEEEIADFSAGLMGVRHVSGPKRWTGYQSARLIDERHKAGKSFLQIGSLLGISDLDAERRFRNYRAFLQMKNDEDYGKYILQKHYTLLAEFLSPSRHSRTWLDWVEDEENDTYEFRNIDNLHRVYRAITSYDGNKAEINNVNQARLFLDYLEDKTRRVMIESNSRLEDIPPLASGDEDRLRQIKGFKFLMDSIDESQVGKEELGLLADIYDSVALLLERKK